MNAETKPALALTMGDPAGIGPEITMRAWMRRGEDAVPPFFVLARCSLYRSLSAALGSGIPTIAVDSPEQATVVFAKALPVLELPSEVGAIRGEPRGNDAAMILRSISAAVEFVQSGRASAVVTNPINKSVLYKAGFTFPGHTEYLAELAGRSEGGSPRAVMMLSGPGLRTVPLTIHEPLHRVPELISRSLIVDTVRILAQDMRTYFGLPAPRIAVCGLNPHAGENGGIGSEEIEIIAPALAFLRGEGIDVRGPLPADTMFHEAARTTYDVALGMYHDQALIPLKMLAFDQGVNITLGLPFVRTSPDHGTAYDIAGKGIASASSLIAALKQADAMVQAAKMSRRG